MRFLIFHHVAYRIDRCSSRASGRSTVNLSASGGGPLYFDRSVCGSVHDREDMASRSRAAETGTGAAAALTSSHRLVRRRAAVSNNNSRRR